MLIDEITAGRRHLAGMGKGFSDLRGSLRTSQAFVLDRSISQVADQMPLAEVIRAAEFSRFPFPATWLEVAHEDRPSFDAPTADDEWRPRRVGVFAERTGPESAAHYAITLAWNFPVGGVVVCPVEMVISFAEPLSPTRWDIRHPDSSTPWPFVMRINRYWRDALERLRSENEAGAMRLVTRSYDDWIGEMSFWFACLALLNAKNGATSERVVIDPKLQRKRAMLDRPALVDYHILKLRLGQRAGPDGPAAGIGVPTRAHVVRGHFKIRKSGMYWWSPHVRGDLSKGFAAKRYEVSEHV